MLDRILAGVDRSLAYKLMVLHIIIIASLLLSHLQKKLDKGQI